jgi:hypothetical protein
MPLHRLPIRSRDRCLPVCARAEVGVGNLLPGTATLAACLFSSALT